MATPEQIPEEIDDLLRRFRDYKTNEAENMKLCAWIREMVQVPGFNYKQIVMASPYNYDVREWNRLKKAVEKTAQKVEVSGKKTLARLEGQDFAVFVEETWAEVKRIGTTVVMKWIEQAKEYGYYDAEKGKVRMADFIEDACNFYVTNKEVIETFQENLDDLQATCSMFADLSKPNIIRIVALRSYMEFINTITLLAARGIPVPESIILEIKETVNNVIVGSYAIKEEQNVQS